MKKLYVTLSLAIAVVGGAFSQGEIVLVKDINPGSQGSLPRAMTNFYDHFYFQAVDGENGVELWKSDGTENGTVLVKNIAPGSSNSNPNHFIHFGNKLFFTANDQVNGTELWITDGTEVGTVMLKDIHPTGSSSPQYFTIYNNYLYFMANDGTHGRELWRTDGTAAGTTLFYDLVVGSGHSDIMGMGVCNNKLFFSSAIHQGGNELWISDGTTAGTTAFLDINTGQGSSNPRQFTPFGNKLLFIASTTAAGDEPYITDGTEAGTFRLADLVPGTGNGGVRDFYVRNNLAYFGGSYGSNTSSAVYVTDGTTAGTTALITQTGVQSVPSTFSHIGNTLFFQWHAPTIQNQLYTLDLNNSTPTIVGAAPMINAMAYGTYMTVFNNKLYFLAKYEETKGQELYVYQMPEVRLTGDAVTGPICGADPVTFVGQHADKFAFLVNGTVVQQMSTDSSFTISTLQNNDNVKVIGYDANDTEIGRDSAYVVKPLVHNTVTVAGATIYSNQASATYLWSGCDGTTLTGTHTNYALNMTATGSVQVQVTKDGCTVTSPCTLVIVEGSGTNPGVGIEFLDANSFAVYPNPTEGSITIELGEEALSGVLFITDLAGKVVQSVNFNSAKSIEFEMNGNPGIYLLNLQTENGNFVKRVTLK